MRLHEVEVQREGFGAIEADEFNFGVRNEETSEVIRIRVPDIGIETAGALGRGEHIPERNPMLPHGGESLFRTLG